MDTQKIVAQFRLSGWGASVQERIESGQSISAFCKEKGISITTYYYRQKKVRKAACTELVKAQKSDTGLVPSGWTQLAEADSATVEESFLTIEVGGCHITARAETNLELLMKVCRVLRSL